MLWKCHVYVFVQLVNFFTLELLNENFSLSTYAEANVFPLLSVSVVVPHDHSERGSVHQC